MGSSKNRIAVFLLGVCTAMGSCMENDLLPVSVDLESGATPDFVVIDTLTLEVSSIRLDSFATTDTERLLVGRHNDEYIGEVSSIPFFEVAYQDLQFYPPSNSRFDSLTLVLYYDYHYFDTLQTQTIDVYRIAEKMELNTYGSLYNTASFSLEKAPLTSISFKPRPNHSDSLEIRMPDALGRELLEKGINADGELFNLVLFTNYLHGFALVPGRDSEGFLGFTKANSSLKLYYSDYTEIPPTGRSYKFPVSQGTICYNKITYDPKGTPLSGIQDQLDEMRSDSTGGLAFIQAGAYMLTKIEVPYLKELLILPGTAYVPHADLIIRPQAGTYGNGNVPLPSYLVGYYGSSNNYSLGNFASTSGFVLDDEFGRDTYYKMDVTQQINNLLDNSTENDYSILLGLEESMMLHGAGRVYLRDGSWQSGMELQVYYIPLNTEDN